MIIALAALVLPAQARADATQALQQQLGPQAVVELDDTTGTPRMLARLDGALSGPSAGDKDDVALRYVHDHRAALGLEQADLDALRPPSSTTSGQITTVRWRQAVDGIPAADSELRVNMAGDGRVLSVLGAPASGLDADTTPPLGAGEAVRAVQDATSSHRPLVPAGPAVGATRATTYVDETTAELALYEERLAWRVTYRVSSDAVYDAFVDARSGRVLKLANLVKAAAPALVWERYPGAAQGGTAATQDLELPGWLAAGAPQLDGPNVRAFSDLDDDDRPAPGEEIARESGTFMAAFRSFVGATCDATHLCSWDATANSWQDNRRQNGVQAFYFANRFHDHLRSLGFTDRAFEGADKLVLHTNDGAATSAGLPNAQHVNNANMLTLPDGRSPIMQMYLWRSGDYRTVNGGDDAAIVYHEYTHGLSNRLVTDAGGAGALNSAQAGAMGEGWSDWYAQDFISPTDTGAAGEVDMGAYVDEEPHTLRHQPLDCPVGASAVACPDAASAGSGGFTYGDFGRIASGPEVHADGEIWGQTLWDLRREVGVANARRLITQGMRLAPPEPSFLDMRNAILQADVAFGTGLHDEIWEVFARRGMGFYAAADDGADVTPVADFSLPPTAGVPRGRIAGRLTDADTDAPITNARAAIGGLTDGPDALAGTTGGDGGYAIEGVPAHDYPGLVLDAPGYDHQIAPVRVTAGTTTTVSAALRRNWAALSGGTSVTGDGTYVDYGCGPQSALDERAGSGWSTDDGVNAAMVLTLPQAVDVSGFAIDPTEACNDTSSSATSRIRIETSSDGASWTRSEHALVRPDNHVPIMVTAPAASIRYVRVTLLENHPGGQFRDLSEFSVYGRPSAGQPPPPPTDTPTATPTPAPTASPRPVPTATPSPSPAAPSFVLPASGKRTARLKVSCAAPCRLTAALTVDRATARRLGLGRKLTAATLTRNLKAGTTTITLKLSSAAARALQQGEPRSFRARLKVSANYAGAKPVSRSRQLTITR